MAYNNFSATLCQNEMQNTPILLLLYVFPKKNPNKIISRCDKSGRKEIAVYCLYMPNLPSPISDSQ